MVTCGRQSRSADVFKPSAFVTYIQNHDQVANSGRGSALICFHHQPYIVPSPL